MLNEEAVRYAKLTGDNSSKVPISRIGGYLDGYDKGRNDAIDDFIEAMEKRQTENWVSNLEYGITFDDMEAVAKQLKSEVE